MGDIVWDKLSEKKRNELIQKIRKLSGKYSRVDYEKPAYANLITRVKFSFCRMLQKSLHKADSEYTDGKYWAAQGWLGSGRPWKQAM